jgi:hypothetical protein
VKKMTEIIDPERCELCGSEKRPPLDGRWRWARGARVFDDLVSAEKRAALLTKQARNPYEFRGAVDLQGRARIASRRTA